MKTLEERTPEGLLTLFTEAQVAVWVESFYGDKGGDKKRYNELKEKANEIRKELLKRMERCEY